MKTLPRATLVLGLLSASFLNAADEVVVNLNVRHSVNGFSEFDRSRFILVHAGLKENDWETDQNRADFLNEYDVYLGRNNGSLPWFLSQTTEHPTNAGWIDHTSLETQGNNVKSSYVSDTASQQLEHRIANHMIGGQMSMYPNGQENGNGFGLGSYDALADYFSGFLSYFFGEGGTDGEPKPYMVEVVNEPFVKANSYQTTKPNIAELHNVVAAKIKEDHPDVLVGGYTAAHPAFEAADFGLWDSNWRMFIDTAGENMDFFSVHLYDYLSPSDHYDSSKTQYRSGSNVEAILDMIEHYSMISLGEVKPFAVSEFGSYEPIDGGEPWTPESNWSDIRSFSSILMQLLERPDRILQAMPFVVLKAEWGRDWNTGHPYGPRLFRQRFEDPEDTGEEWVYSELIQFYELWKNVNGIRLDTTSEDLDVQVDAYVDDKKLHLILNNLELEPKQVDLRFVSTERNAIVSAVSKQTFAINGAPLIEEIQHEDIPSTLTLEANATMIIEYDFTDQVLVDQSSEEQKYYANTYLQTIDSSQDITFEIDDVSVPTFGEAVLRVGIGRSHEKSLKPIVKFNEETVEVPEDWRGYDQGTRSSFFGVIEIPIPITLLQANNSITVQFDDNGGHVSSVTMQVWEFSSSFRERSARESLDLFTFQYDTSEKQFDLQTFGEIGKHYTVQESGDLLKWDKASETKPGQSRWVEFEVDGSHSTFLRILETDSQDDTVNP